MRGSMTMYKKPTSRLVPSAAQRRTEIIKRLASRPPVAPVRNPLETIRLR